jgi:cell division protein FtsL
MSQKFYQKASVQVAMVTAIGLIIVTLITIAHQRSQLKSDNNRLQRENESKTTEIQRLETLLTPFRTIALEKYTLPEAEALRKLAKQIGVLQDADKQKKEKITQLEKELIQTKSLAEPCKLAFLSKNIEKVDQGYRVTMRFKPTKNERLGLLAFSAALPVNADNQILDFWPSKNSSFTSGKNSKKIENNGKSALLRYSLLGFGYPSIDLVVSGPTKVQIQGNNGLETFEIDVQATAEQNNKPD